MKARHIHFFGLLICLSLIATAYYMQLVMGLEPCPLCMMQRFVIYTIALLFALGWLHNPEHFGQRIYATLITLSSLAGAGFASRQLWLQSLPEDQVPACGPSFDYMVDVLPWSDLISAMMRGTGDCAKIQWTFLSLSIPGWTQIAFITLALLGLILWRKRSI
jgi:disulfide bond formation protein DsbB